MGWLVQSKLAEGRWEGTDGSLTAQVTPLQCLFPF